MDGGLDGGGGTERSLDWPGFVLEFFSASVVARVLLLLKAQPVT